LGIEKDETELLSDHKELRKSTLVAKNTFIDIL
jgi:hypothetical protein